MATQTLLDMTQEILSALSSDEVNSISDTVESLQVATCIKRAYLNLASRSGLPEDSQYIQLNPSLNSLTPVIMTVPDNVSSIKWIKYFDANSLDGTTPNTFQHDVNTDIHATGTSATNGTPGYLDVMMLGVREFTDHVTKFNPTDTAVDTFTFTDSINSIPGHYTFNYMNNTQPRFCTVISNLYVIFDSYDQTVDDTLQASKTMCYGQVAPTFRMEDSFIPRLAERDFPLLMSEAKALAFYELKQMPHQKAEQESRRQWSSLQKNKSVDNKPSAFDQLPNFGRNSLATRPYWYGKRY